jgi:uncharacterized membrane protein YvbJ
MRVVLNATCSECYGASELILSEKTKEIICPTCGHSVPPLDDQAMKALTKDQNQRRIFAGASGGAFLLALIFFCVFMSKAGGGDPAAMTQLPGDAVAMMAIAIVCLLGSLVLGFLAASRSYVCEF